MIGPNLIQCSLCQGSLPASNDEVFQGHMQFQHRAYYDLDFMFAVFSLNAEDKAIVLDLINEQLEQRDQNAMLDKKPTKHENSMAKLEVPVNLPSHISVTSIQDNIASDINVNESEQSYTCDENEKLKDNDKEKELLSLEENTIVETKNSVKKIAQEIQFTKKNIPEHNKVRSRRRRSKFEVPLRGPGFCKDCGKDEKHLGYHRQREHGTISVCDLCNATLKSLTRLKIHKRRFHRPYSPCPDCGKLVKKMELHQKTQHTNNEDKKWKCSSCGKGFALKFALIEHERIHGEKQFPCRVSNGLCGKASTSPGNRTKHEALCKYWETLGLKSEQSGNIKCEVEFEEGKLELDV